jgi:predicted amidohydrolase
LVAPQIAREFDQRFEQLLSELDGVDLLVLTEGYDGRFGLMLKTVREKWARYAQAHQQAVLLSSYTVEQNGWKGNATAGITKEGQFVGVHRKVDLAFYGERTLAAGTSYELLPLSPGLAVGASICLESLLPGAPRTTTRSGANLLAVSTSDITFGSGIPGFEHLATTQLRAIEVGRATIWASNGGPSGVIDRWGEFDAAAPFRRPAAAKMTATLYDDQTFFLRHSQGLLILAPVVLVLATSFTSRWGKARHEPELAPPLFFDALARSPLRAVAAAAACLFSSAALVCAGPALVECSRGEPARAGAAVSGAFTRPVTRIQDGWVDRFHAGPERSADGALAYFLSYYGIESRASDFSTDLGQPGSLAELGAYLRLHAAVPTREVPLTPGALPRVAVLVRFRDGRYGVLSDPNGESQAALFSGAQGTPLPIDMRTLQAVLEPIGLIPSAI